MQARRGVGGMPAAACAYGPGGGAAPAWVMGR